MIPVQARTAADLGLKKQAPGFPWPSHLTIGEADECARLEQLAWNGCAAWHEADRLRVLRSKRLRSGLRQAT